MDIIMIKRYITVLLLVTLMLTTLSAGESWRLVNQKSGITVYGDDSVIGSAKKYKAIGIVDASVWTVLALMEDLDSYPEWNGNCIHAEVIVPRRDGVMLQYFVNSAPWPVKGRDVILRTEEFIDLSDVGEDGNENALIEIDIRSVKDEIVPPKDGYVRMTELTGYWKFKGLPGNRTEIIYTISTDLAGKIPSAISNMVSKDIPFDTMVSIRRMVQLEKYRDAGKKYLNSLP
jgi:ribosome-associated toxin RatA of RatAB toxin-antitoxin module